MDFRRQRPRRRGPTCPERLGDGKPGSAFPWCTLAVNLTGSWAIGFVATFLVGIGSAPGAQWAGDFLVVGVLGGFTTYSAYALQIPLLAWGGHALRATVNAAGTPVLASLRWRWGRRWRAACLFLNRIPIVASPKFLLADVFGPSEASAAKLSPANLRDLLRQPRESSASLGRNPLFSTQFFPMPRSTLVLAGALVLAFATSLHAAKIVLVAGGPEAPATAQLREPFGVEFNTAGDAFIIEMAKGNRLLRLDPKTGVLTHVAGQSNPGDSGDGSPALRAQFNGPHNLAVHPDGRVFISDTWNGRIRVYDPATGLVTSLAGYGVPAAQGRANGPYCVALNPAGTHLFIADLRRVQALDLATGKLAIVAGNGEKGVPADGAVATAAPLTDPRAVAIDRHGHVYILERNGHALRVVTPDGRIRTVINVAGKKGVPADGAVATAAPLTDPRAVAIDRHGHVYILERNGHALRVVTPDGRIRTVINVAGKKGATGDGGDAREATLNGPKHLCIDRDDSVLIADAENNLIRRYVPATGKILRVAGTGKKGAAGLDGPPDQAELARPHGVTVHRDGTLYITDSYNDRILKIGP